MTLTNEQRAKGGRARGKRIPPRTVSDTLQQIFLLISEKDMSLAELAFALRQNPNRLSTWRSGKAAPSVLRVEEMAQVLGYRFVLVPIEKERDNA